MNQEGQYNEVRDKGPVMEEREPSQGFRLAYGKVLEKLRDYRQDANSQVQGMRVFKADSSCKLGFMSMEAFRRNFGKGIEALYLFKLQFEHKDGYTHGMHVRVCGYAPRRLFDHLLTEIASYFLGKEVELKSVVPSGKKTLSLFDYLQSLFVHPGNLYVNYSHQSDAITVQQKREGKPNHSCMSSLKERMLKLTLQILENMIAMPSTYPICQLTQLLGMSQAEYRKFMRTTSLNDIVHLIAQDAYSYALQDNSHKLKDVQELMDPLTRRAMLNRAVNERITRGIQLLFQQTFSVSFVHPHPYNGIIKSDLQNRKCLDGMLFDPRFLLPMLLTSRWFARACMRDDDRATNNHAHLLLYGGTGTGKSLLLNTIASNITCYKYLVNSRFQNPDMLQSSIFSIEEFDTKMLASNQYKQLLDLKAHVKTDFKNLHPENVSEGVPCMITSNDDILSVLSTQRLFGQASIEAALRRLYIIPMKMGQFEKIHTLLAETDCASENRGVVAQYGDMLMREEFRLDRMFNFIVSFALHQTDISGMYFDYRLHSYFQKLIKDFRQSLFGTFYLKTKRVVDKLIQDLEAVMVKQDLNDTEYLTQFAVTVGNLQQQIYHFIEQHCKGIKEIDVSVIKDSQLAWPSRIYYFLQNKRVIANLLCCNTMEEQENGLNLEVKGFVVNPEMAIFTPTANIFPIQDQSPFTSEKDAEEEKDQFMTPPRTDRLLECPLLPRKRGPPSRLESYFDNDETVLMMRNFSGYSYDNDQLFQ